MILLTGASGYVGGRLLARLERDGFPVRCLARHPEYLKSRVAPTTEVVPGDVFDPASLEAALARANVAYYLVHSMGSAVDFEEGDRRGAMNFAAAARKAGVSRIVYLGGLGRGPHLSAHLASRQEVGSLLRASGVPTVELRASIIIGSGSISFEMIRALVERLPVMIMPRWVRLKAQPIAVEDLLDYLEEAMTIPEGACGVYEIGGRDAATYEEIMAEYARQRGLRRLMIPVPVLTPNISSLWLGLVTPLYARVGRKLFTSLRNASVVVDARARTVFSVEPRGMREAVARALVNEDLEYAATRWTDALSSKGERPGPTARAGQRFVDSRALSTPASPEALFGALSRLGGRGGWYADPLWSIRGAVDLLLGGVGMRRGRIEGRPPRPGDALDFWRVERVEERSLLRLRSEMRLPGRAWLQFEIAREAGGSRLIQTAIFDSLGLPGFLYWYLLYPAHWLIFRGMLRELVRRAETA